MKLKISLTPKPHFLPLFLGLVFCFYTWTAVTTPTTGYYAMLADALLHGQTSLLVEPTKELLASSDPYDPPQHKKAEGVWDASLYQGKYYLYFGIVPAVVLFAPFKFFFDKDLVDSIGVVFFGFEGLLFCVLLLRFLTKLYLPKTPAWMFNLAVACLSFSNVVPFILRRPAFYEVAITAGYFFLFGGLYFLARGCLEEKNKPWRLAWGSLFLGLAVGSRPNLILAAPILGLVWFKWVYEQPRCTVLPAIKHACLLLGPYLVCMGMLGLYNYVRFDAWTEFGNHYQLTVQNPRTFRYGNFGVMFLSLYSYLFYPVQINGNFPFFHLPLSFPQEVGQPEPWYGIEKVAGIFTTTPILALLLLLPFVLKSNPKRVMLVLMMLGLAILFFVAYHQPGATMRYEVDFVSLLLLPALFLWFYITEHQKNNNCRYRFFQGIAVFSILYGCLVGIAISITGYFDLLKIFYPEIYNSLEHFFSFS